MKKICLLFLLLILTGCGIKGPVEYEIVLKEHISGDVQIIDIEIENGSHIKQEKLIQEKYILIVVEPCNKKEIKKRIRVSKQEYMKYKIGDKIRTYL